MSDDVTALRDRIVEAAARAIAGERATRKAAIAALAAAVQAQSSSNRLRAVADALDDRGVYDDVALLLRALAGIGDGRGD